uniref:Uncharacterized protein n=1 Tax=Amphimedon queenslandica TaxID=400682 RepID=A0A1X7VHX7_AMPQE
MACTENPAKMEIGTKTETQKVVMLNEAKERPAVRKSRSKPTLRVQKSQTVVKGIPEPDGDNIDYKLRFDEKQ